MIYKYSLAISSFEKFCDLPYSSQQAGRQACLLAWMEDNIIIVFSGYCIFVWS